MTIWNNIYKNYQKDSRVWSKTLSGDIHPLFNKFLNQSDFEFKYALDVGCGTGKYLKFLQARGFKTDGIDSSEIAVEMAKKLLSDKSIILYADMFVSKIHHNKYDLIVSIGTIHHGTKDQIKNLINKIYESIVNNGKIFITMPDFKSGKKWNTFKDHKEITKGTFIPLSGPEKGLPHSFYKKEEVQKLFSKFRDLHLDLDNRGQWVIQASK